MLIALGASNANAVKPKVDSPLARGIKLADERMKHALIGEYGDCNVHGVIASLESTDNGLNINKALLLRNAIKRIGAEKDFFLRSMAKEEALIIFRGKLSPRARQKPGAFSRLCDRLYELNRKYRYSLSFEEWFLSPKVTEIIFALKQITPSQEAQPGA
jgi:hypothetical protein